MVYELDDEFWVYDFSQPSSLIEGAVRNFGLCAGAPDHFWSNSDSVLFARDRVTNVSRDLGAAVGRVLFVDYSSCNNIFIDREDRLRILVQGEALASAPISDGLRCLHNENYQCGWGGALQISAEHAAFINRRDPLGADSLYVVPVH